MSSKLLNGIALVLLAFTFFGKYSSYNISESITDWTNVAFWIALGIAYVLKGKGK